jgi:hypothetical protein
MMRHARLFMSALAASAVACGTTPERRGDAAFPSRGGAIFAV